MLGVLLIYFIGKYYYKLAEAFDKNCWVFAILGVVVYYVGTAVGGFIIGMLNELFHWQLDFDNALLLSLIALPFGILFTWGLYMLLKKQWTDALPVIVDDIQDIGNRDL